MTVRKSLLMSAAFGAMLMIGGGTFAQVPGTNLGTPQSQPQPGGGVATGPGAPTSATRSVTPMPSDAGSSVGRGPPAAGGGTATMGSDGNANLTPGGAIRPGTSSPGGTGGSSR